MDYQLYCNDAGGGPDFEPAVFGFTRLRSLPGEGLSRRSRGLDERRGEGMLAGDHEERCRRGRKRVRNSRAVSITLPGYPIPS